MKYFMVTGFILLLLFCSTGLFCQNTISLDIRVQDSASGSGAAMLKKLRMKNPAVVEYTELDKKVEQLIGYYENAGYPFVEIRLDSISTGTEGLQAQLMVDPGQRVIFDTLLNRTGFRISLPVLSRLMNIRTGDVYRESSLGEASRRLGQVPYLRLTRPLEVGFHPGKASVYVYPEKAGSNRFDGWIGLSPDLRTAGKLAFSGALLLNLDNVLGQGENWLFDWQRNQDASQKLNLGAHIQYLAGLPFGLKGKFGLYRQDTSYLNVEWDLGIPYHFSPDHLINVFVRKRESSLLAPAADLTNSSRHPFESFLSGLSWEYSRLDNRINPHHGFVFKAEVVTGRKSLPDSISMQQTELIADASWFVPLARSMTCGLLLQSGYRKTPVTYENEQYRLGGFNLLRGFDEDIFHTNAFAVGSIELRYLLDRSSHLIVLTDLGVLSTIDNDEKIIKIPLGVGLGGQIRTAGGIFRIIFALGKAGEQPFNFKNSKIHLGYVGVF